jgi:hypothetical protein
MLKECDARKTTTLSQLERAMFSGGVWNVIRDTRAPRASADHGADCVKTPPDLGVTDARDIATMMACRASRGLEIQYSQL